MKKKKITIRRTKQLFYIYYRRAEGKYEGEETEAIRYKYIPIYNFEEII
jgi:hypothetical protein